MGGWEALFVAQLPELVKGLALWDSFFENTNSILGATGFRLPKVQMSNINSSFSITKH